MVGLLRRGPSIEYFCVLENNELAILAESGAHREPKVCEGCFLRKAIAILAESGAHQQPKVCEGCFL